MDRVPPRASLKGKGLAGLPQGDLNIENPGLLVEREFRADLRSPDEQRGDEREDARDHDPEELEWLPCRGDGGDGEASDVLEIAVEYRLPVEASEYTGQATGAQHERGFPGKDT